MLIIISLFFKSFTVQQNTPYKIQKCNLMLTLVLTSKNELNLLLFSGNFAMGQLSSGVGAETPDEKQGGCPVLLFMLLKLPHL
jgi:hypothetical protein